MKKPRFNLFLCFTVIIILLAIVFALGNLIRILQTSDYFRVRDIIASEDNIIDFSYFKGKNIFSIDLQKQSAYLTRYYPVYRKIRLVRVLPNRLFVNFIKRKPLAIIKLYRQLLVDEEGVVFNLPEGEDHSDLPLILGLETKIFGPKSGSKYNIKELTLALNIIKEVKESRISRDYTLKRINVTELNSASFLLLPKNQAVIEVKGLEVKFGADNIKEKINVLIGLLVQDKNDLANSEYIDLRFKEPVIKFRNTK